MLIINEKDIAAVFDTNEVIAAIEKAYSLQDEHSTLIPDRAHINYGINTLLLMPGFTNHIMGTKLVSVFPENRAKGKPVIYGQMILNDLETGEPLALINGNKLTAVRTGGVGATAIKHLASDNVNTLGIIGAGVQGFHQLLLSVKVKPFRKIIVFDSNVKQAEKVVGEIKQHYPEMEVSVCRLANELVTQSDVIITATTSAKPVFDVNPQLLNGKLFIGIGSYKPEMTELPPEVMAAANTIFVDTPHAMDESGDLVIPLRKNIIKKEKIVPFNKLLTSQVKKSSGINVFKSAGMALFDLIVADYLYRKCLTQGMGTEIEF